MRRVLSTARRLPAGLTVLATALSFALSLTVTSAAQAVVVDMNALGQPSVAYSASDQSGYYGVDVVPGTAAALSSAGVPVVTSSGPCLDPALPLNMSLPSTGLCSHGGSVMHSNETFAMVWDPAPHKDYASPYVEQFLRDVADGSGKLTSPYAVTPQYTDGAGRAGNSSAYGGGYDSSDAYPANGCTVSGIHNYYLQGSAYTSVPNDVCLTDAQLQSELRGMIGQNGIPGRIQAGYTPVLVMLTPPGVETCLDGAAHLCSANSDSSQVGAQFCSYHSQLTYSGRVYDYVVQPWAVAQNWPVNTTGCDEPDAAPLPTGTIDPNALQKAMGQRLVSPLSSAQLAAITNPNMNGWFALNGSEVNDNGCAPIGSGLDAATVGANSYFLSRAANNAGLIVNDPYALPCAPSIELQPQFVVPSAVDAGDVVQFDGSKTLSGLLVPTNDYIWSFGDGTTGIGPSVVHSYAYGGNYAVKLITVDRGGNLATLTQSITVLGPHQTPPASPPPAPPTTHHVGPSFSVRLVILPQSLQNVLAHGVKLRVISNAAADGFVSVLISRRAARLAHIAAHGPAVVIGRGTTSGVVRSGTITLRLRLSRTVSAKLRRLRHVTLTYRLSLTSTSRQHLTIVQAGSY